jgi:hypothetical protein
VTNPHDTKGEQPTNFTDPPMEEECKYCGGAEVLEIAGVITIEDELEPWPMLTPDSEVPEVPCPWCQGG